MSSNFSTLSSLATLEPIEKRRALTRLFASMPAHAQEEASAIVASLPRLIHHLALAGALAAPEFATGDNIGQAA